MHIILINGKPGTGKTSVSRKLLGMIPEPSAWIDTDDLMRVRPFGEHIFSEALDRALVLAEGFLQKDYVTLVLSGCVHSMPLVEQIQRSAVSACDITYVLLTVSPETSEMRKKAQGYSPDTHANMFEIIRSEGTSLVANDVNPWQWLSIDTAKEEPETIARRILGC